MRFPATANEILEIIEENERHRKYVWTVGRVLQRAALLTNFEQLNYAERKALRHRLEALLEQLAGEGVLSRRPEIQTIGFGEETGFDYVQGSCREIPSA